MKKARKTPLRAGRPAPKQHTLESFANLTLAEQIQAARPVAHTLLEEAIDSYARVDEPLTFHLSRLLGDDVLDRVCDREIDAWTTRFEAMLAVGIALGLMLRPEAFEIGGAR